MSRKENSQSNRIFEKHFINFYKLIYKEKDFAIVILKSHLLVESYLDHLILLTGEDYINLRRFGFQDKLHFLGKHNDLFSNRGSMLGALYRLNEVRNNFAHKLDFKVSQDDIDLIGYEFGKDYIIKKYSFSKDSPETKREILLWLMDSLLRVTLVPLSIKLLEEKKFLKPNNTK